MGTVRAIQTRKGSGSGYAMEERGVIGDAFGPDLSDFIAKLKKK